MMPLCGLELLRIGRLHVMLLDVCWSGGVGRHVPQGWPGQRSAAGAVPPPRGGMPWVSLPGVFEVSLVGWAGLRLECWIPRF